MFDIIQGKKTHLLVVAYVVLLIVTDQPIAGDETLGGFDVETIKEGLLAFMVSTAKMAWDRFAASREETPAE